MNQVQSADGTSIAFETTGSGPVLVLIGGAFCDRRAKASGTPFAALLAPHFTVVSYDRRGRGDSGDAPPYAVEREVEDLAALVAEVGGTASIYGISSGGILALEAAARKLPVEKLAVYEAPLVLDASRRPSQGLAENLDELCALGRRSDAAELFLSRVVGVPTAAVAGMKQAPMWRGLEALAHTLSYDVRLAHDAPALLERLGRVVAPTLVSCGGASPPWMHEGAREIVSSLPHARYRTLAGQTHDVDPVVLAGALTEFFAE